MAVLATLYVARPIVLPIVLAVVLKFLLQLLIRVADRLMAFGHFLQGTTKDPLT